MSQEATVQSYLSLRIKGAGSIIEQDYQSRPQSFVADVSRAGGPTPGQILASLTGSQITLTALTQPGLCRIQNLGVDASGNSLFGTANDQYNWSNYVEVGIYLPSILEFIPIIELLPGESYVMRLSRFLGSGFGGTETGTSPELSSLQLWVRSIGTASKVLVEAFER